MFLIVCTGERSAPFLIHPGQGQNRQQRSRNPPFFPNALKPRPGASDSCLDRERPGSPRVELRGSRALFERLEPRYHDAAIEARDSIDRVTNRFAASRLEGEPAEFSSYLQEQAVR